MEGEAVPAVLSRSRWSVPGALAAGTRGPRAPSGVVLGAGARVHPTLLVHHPFGWCPGPVVGGFAPGTQPVSRAGEYSGCAAVCRAASCCAVLFRAVVCGGSIVPQVWRGVAPALVRLVSLLCGTRAEVIWLAGCRGAWFGVLRLLGSVLLGSGCAVCSGGSGGCPWGCPPLGPVPWSRVLWGSLSLGVCQVLWGGIAWCPRLCWVPSHPVPLSPCRPPCLVSQPCPLSPPASVLLRLCVGPCSGRGRRLAVRVRCWVMWCSRRFPLWVYPLPLVWVYPPSPVRGLLVGGRDPVWFVRCQVWAAAARLGGRAPPGWSALCLGVAVSLGGLAVSTGRGGLGGAGTSGVVFPSFVVCVLAPVIPPSPPVPWPLAFPFPRVGGPRVVPCPHVVLPPLPFPCWRLPVTLGLSSPPCRAPSPCPFCNTFPFWCAGGGVVARPVSADGPCPGPVGLEPPAEGSRGVGAAEALDRVRRRDSNALCGMAASGAGSPGSAGQGVRISSKVWKE